MAWHVIPLDDDIEHDTAEGSCPCEPVEEYVTRPDGSNGWLVTHRRIEKEFTCSGNGTES
jgi:hypothetical protein